MFYSSERTVAAPLRMHSLQLACSRQSSAETARGESMPASMLLVMLLELDVRKRIVPRDARDVVFADDMSCSVRSLVMPQSATSSASGEDNTLMPSCNAGVYLHRQRHLMQKAQGVGQYSSHVCIVLNTLLHTGSHKSPMQPSSSLSF